MIKAQERLGLYQIGMYLMINGRENWYSRQPHKLSSAGSIPAPATNLYQISSKIHHSVPKVLEGKWIACGNNDLIPTTLDIDMYWSMITKKVMKEISLDIDRAILGLTNTKGRGII
jgi:hypothetical protein